ncbi:hypothetical protein [Saccharopolyspora taberi]|uniref:Uncharacterized protein n=1 Tax=Saccharopolyspora taberi TaxID=60895 RepID=A0ABN3V735_9PSEU
MIKSVSRVLVSAAVLLAPLAVAPTAQADVDDCVAHAVVNGGNEHLAAYACHEETLTGCYRIFRDNYGPQQWALEACQRRNG